MKGFEEALITEERLLKPSDVAELLNISRSMSYRLLQNGMIPSIRINRMVRVRQRDLQFFIEQRRIENRSK